MPSTMSRRYSLPRMSAAFSAAIVASGVNRVSTSMFAAMRDRMIALLAKISCTCSVAAVTLPSICFSVETSSPFSSTETE